MLLVAAAALTGACHVRAPEVAPGPAPQGQPPTVQLPVGTGPIEETAPPAAPSAVDPQLRRFDVVAVQDTTFTILIGTARWIRRGTTGVAVDPKRRDALVARFRVLSRDGDSATALITGQTTRVSPTHVALVREPASGPLGQGVFWGGVLLGLAAGVGAAVLIRR